MRVFIGLLLMLSGYAFAGCSTIDNADLRYLCNAKNGQGSCGSISNSDLRAQCDALKR